MRFEIMGSAVSGGSGIWFAHDVHVSAWKHYELVAATARKLAYWEFCRSFDRCYIFSSSRQCRIVSQSTS
jgi:hypothetical protein